MGYRSFIYLFIFLPFFLVWFKMYFCFWSNCIESASKTEPSETIDFHVAFQSICHLVCTLCDYWFSSNAACGCFQYTDTSRNRNVFSLFFFVIFRYGNTKILYETNLWNPWSEYSKRWLLVLLVFVSLSFMEWRFYSVYSFSISKSEYILLMNFTNTHNNRLIHYSLSLYTTCSTQKTMNVYNKINKQSSTHLICLSLCVSVCVYVCERECVYDVYCIRLFGCYVLFILLGCYLLWNRILNNESRACKSLPFIFVHFEQMLSEYYVM